MSDAGGGRQHPHTSRARVHELGSKHHAGAWYRHACGSDACAGVAYSTVPPGLTRSVILRNEGRTCDARPRSVRSSRYCPRGWRGADARDGCEGVRLSAVYTPYRLQYVRTYVPRWAAPRRGASSCPASSGTRCQRVYARQRMGYTYVTAYSVARVCGCQLYTPHTVYVDGQTRAVERALLLRARERAASARYPERSCDAGYPRWHGRCCEGARQSASGCTPTRRAHE